MARTRRSCPDWADYDESVKSLFRRGHLHIPKRKTLKKAGKTTERWAEIWHPSAKKLSKAIARRKTRRAGQRAIKDLEE